MNPFIKSLFPCQVDNYLVVWRPGYKRLSQIGLSTNQSFRLLGHHHEFPLEIFFFQDIHS